MNNIGDDYGWKTYLIFFILLSLGYIPIILGNPLTPIQYLLWSMFCFSIIVISNIIKKRGRK